MKKILCFILFSLFLVSCSNNELTNEEAKKIIEQHYQLPFQTKIAIDRKYDDYGWPPEKYRQLLNMGLISQREVSSFITKSFQISLTEKARDYWLQNGTLQAPEGSKWIIVFKGYLIELKDVNISSNAKENTAEAKVVFKISNVSPFQEVFNPIESNEINGTINFKLYNNGWEIVEDENSKKLFKPINAPQHWMGGWKIVYDNSPAIEPINLDILMGNWDSFDGKLSMYIHKSDNEYIVEAFDSNRMNRPDSDLEKTIIIATKLDHFLFRNIYKDGKIIEDDVDYYKDKDQMRISKSNYYFKRGSNEIDSEVETEPWVDPKIK